MAVNKTTKNPKSHRNKLVLFWGGLVGFLVGVIGNLLAAWIQQDILANTFTRERVLLIFLFALCGVLAGALFHREFDSGDSVTGELSKAGNILSRITLLWSRIKLRGQRNKIEDTKSVGSSIDIDSRE